MSFWRKIATEQLVVGPAFHGPWMKIVAINIGAVTQAPASWHGKIAALLTLPIETAEDYLARVIYDAGTLVGIWILSGSYWLDGGNWDDTKTWQD